MIDQDFLSTIRETEEKAEAMASEAQAKARQLVEDTRAEADRRIAAARGKAEEIVHQTIENASSLAAEKDKQVTAATAIQTKIIRDAAVPAMDKAIQIVAERIVK